MPFPQEKARPPRPSPNGTASQSPRLPPRGYLGSPSVTPINRNAVVAKWLPLAIGHNVVGVVSPVQTAPEVGASRQPWAAGRCPFGALIRRAAPIQKIALGLSNWCLSSVIPTPADHRRASRAFPPNVIPFPQDKARPARQVAAPCSPRFAPSVGQIAHQTCALDCEQRKICFRR